MPVVMLRRRMPCSGTLHSVGGWVQPVLATGTHNLHPQLATQADSSAEDLIGGLRNNPNRLHLPLFTFNYFCISNPLLLTHCAEVWKLFSQYTRCTLDVIPFRLQSVNPRKLGSLETVLSIHSVRSGFNSFQTAAISESCLQ